MEQVTLSSLPTGLFLRDGPTYFIQNNQNINLSSCLSGDIVQQALEGLNTSTLSQTQWDVNKQRSTLDQNYFVLNKDTIEEEEEGVVQLSISDDYPIHLLNSTKIGEINTNPDQQGCLVENVLHSESDKSENSLSIDTLNSLLQVSPNNGSNELCDVSSNMKGNVTYAYQLTNGAKINQVIQNACLTIPVNTSNGLANTQNLLIKNSELIQAAPEKSNGNGKKLILVHGVNFKPKGLLNLKNKGNQDAIKNFQKVRIVTANSPIFKNQQNVTQKMMFPPTNRPQPTISIPAGQTVNPLQYQDFKSKPPSSAQALSNFLKLRAANPASSAVKATNSSPSTLSKNDLVDLVTSSPKDPVPTIDSSLLFKIPKSPINESQPGERLSDSELKKIATAFHNGELNIDKLNNSATLYDTDSKTKIICRIVYPEELVHEKSKEAEPNGKKKVRGRPKKVFPEVTLKKIKEPQNLARTRSGRLSRPPRYMLKDFKKLKMENSDISSSDNETEEADENIENTPAVYKEVLVRRRLIKSRCPTCGKSYPGRKMLLHLTKYPDHGDVNSALFTLVDSAQKPKSFKSTKERRKFLHRAKMDPNLLKEVLNSYSDEVFLSLVKERFCKAMSPSNYLLERQPEGEGAVKGLLSDLTDIMNSLQPNLLHNADPTEPNAIHVVDERLCAVLNITPGSYLPNDSAVKRAWAVEPDIPSSAPIPMEVGPLMAGKVDEESEKKMDTSLELDKKEAELVDLLGDKSSLEAVDEILHERLNDLIPLDDVSSLVEGPSLDRSLFSTNSLELHSVSESTEDLLKTLENLTPELPPVSVPTDFDFSVLSTDFVNER